MKEKWKDKKYRENQITAQNNGKSAPEHKANMSEIIKERWKDPEYAEKVSDGLKKRFADKTKHPRFGTTHTPETKKKMSRNHADVSGENNPMYGVRGKDAPAYGKPTPHSKGRWFALPNGENIWIRSSYEERALTVILSIGIAWIYEPKAFPIIVDDKNTTYRPDFYFPEYNMWWNTKGTKRNGDWVYPKSRKKVEAFLKQYPEENLKILYESDIDQLEHAFTRGNVIDITKFGQHLLEY